MSVAERHEHRVKFILGLLEENPKGLRRKQLKIRWTTSGICESGFNKTIVWLRQRRYIKKASEFSLSPYVITEAGRKYLNGLRA